VDGLYLHLWRYRLHARPESRKEHWLHTFRSLLFPGILATLFLVPPYGVVLWLGLALLAVDQVVEILDVSSELLVAFSCKGRKQRWSGYSTVKLSSLAMGGLVTAVTVSVSPVSGAVVSLVKPKKSKVPGPSPSPSWRSGR
jgi:hypothetical protein